VQGATELLPADIYPCLDLTPYSFDAGIPQSLLGTPSPPTVERAIMDRTVKIDAQGRVAIPAAMRASLGLKTGDTLFAHLDEETGGVRLAKAINPFDLLFEHATREYRAGKTTNLGDFLAGEIDEPDRDDVKTVQGRVDRRGQEGSQEATPAPRADR
jgi:AbrB family looped-hinge helix DNA binding protein